MAENGQGVDFDEDTAKKILSEKKVKIILDMKQGKELARAWGCDLTEKYVEINGRYRT